MTEEEQLQIALDNCAKEPIHLSGAIQSYGFLLVLSDPELNIIGISENLLSAKGLAKENTFNQPLTLLFSKKESDYLKKVVSSWHENLKNNYFKTVNPISLTLSLKGEKRLMDGVISKSNHGFVLELENIHSENFQEEKDTFFQTNKKSIIRAQNSQKLDELYQTVVEEIKSIVGFNKVMLYKFDKEYNGTVVAEDKSEEMVSFLGMRFPNTDIPEQARELYLKNLLRIVSDVHYEPIPILLEKSIANEPLDLSQVNLRSVSPLHIKYMKNMRVTASMSISIVVNGKLWGLITCHHDSPKYLSYSTRMTAEFFAQLISLQIENLEFANLQYEKIKRKTIVDGIIESLKEESEIYRGIMRKKNSLMELVDADGFAVINQDEIFIAGETPTESQVKKIADWLSTRKQKGVFASNAMTKEISFASKFVKSGSGMLSIPLAKEDNSRLFWFRKEKKEKVKWAGVPKKEIKEKDGEFVLEPRESFLQWNQNTIYTTEPWRDAEIEIVEALQIKMLYIITRQINEERKQKIQQELATQVKMRTEELTNINEKLKFEVKGRAKVEERLKEGMRELEATNKELEHFAYVASHDLQEPLRVISSFTELLAKRYQKDLDQKANTYIDFILDGSSRMKQLIMDLLEYSRLSKKNVPDKPIELNEVYSDVVKSLKLQIEETETQLVTGDLPTIFGNRTKMNQLFQNLIGNAIKYRKPDIPPIIKINVEDADSHWEFSIADNGIGIPPKYEKRIFVIFQRLHTKDEFSGTGIGLSLCQKIVEQQNGKIWLDTEAEDGTTIRFTLKKYKK